MTEPNPERHPDDGDRDDGPVFAATESTYLTLADRLSVSTTGLWRVVVHFPGDRPLAEQLLGQVIQSMPPEVLSGFVTSLVDAPDEPSTDGTTPFALSGSPSLVLSVLLNLGIWLSQPADQQLPLGALAAANDVLSTFEEDGS